MIANFSFGQVVGLAQQGLSNIDGATVMAVADNPWVQKGVNFGAGVLCPQAKAGLIVAERGWDIVQDIATEQSVKDIQDTLAVFQEQTISQLGDIQNGLGVLQATTAAIGVGTVATVALSAVNLHQTFKLREDVQQMRLQIDNGFIDLKQALRDQGQEILYRIDLVAQDVEYNHHKTILAQAYGDFVHAVGWLKDTLHSSDWESQKSTVANIQGMFQKSLSAYNNPAIYTQTSAAGKLRRLECAWMIDQTITITYQLLQEYDIVQKRLTELQQKIKQESLSLIDQCASEAELEFLAPELMRINRVDIQMFENWKNNLAWLQSSTTEDRKILFQLLAASQNSEVAIQPVEVTQVPSEIVEYETLKNQSHYNSLLDQVRFVVKPELRRDRETFISQKADEVGYNAIASPNWEEVPDLTVANLYWYFQDR